MKKSCVMSYEKERELRKVRQKDVDLVLTKKAKCLVMYYSMSFGVWHKTNSESMHAHLHSKD